MKKVYLFLATGFEEIEAVATIDVLRRGGLEVTVVSVSGELAVAGGHHITIVADALFADLDYSDGDLLVLPGGQTGQINLNAHEGVKALLLAYAAQGKKIAAICAAPAVLGGLGLLEGKNVTAYPGFEDYLAGANYTGEGVVIDGNIITGKGPGYANQFGLAIVSELTDSVQAEAVAAGMLL